MITMSTEPVTVRGEALHEEFWTGRQWAVTAYGIEKRDGTYVIKAGRLLEDLPDHSWIAHMTEKTWLDFDDFATAFFVALSYHGANPTADDIAAFKDHIVRNEPRIDRRREARRMEIEK
jgi:hypothetical protein